MLKNINFRSTKQYLTSGTCFNCFVKGTGAMFPRILPAHILQRLYSQCILKRRPLNDINKLPNLGYVPTETDKLPHCSIWRGFFCKKIFLYNTQRLCFKEERLFMGIKRGYLKRYTVHLDYYTFLYSNFPTTVNNVLIRITSRVLTCNYFFNISVHIVVLDIFKGHADILFLSITSRVYSYSLLNMASLILKYYINFHRNISIDLRLIKLSKSKTSLLCHNILKKTSEGWTYSAANRSYVLCKSNRTISLNL